MTDGITWLNENRVYKIEDYLTLSQFTMEMPTKRSRTEDEMQSFLDQIPIPEYSCSETCNIEKTRLEKLEEDVTSIRSNLERKRPKVTLMQLNEKIDLILNILHSWNSWISMPGTSWCARECHTIYSGEVVCSKYKESCNLYSPIYSCLIHGNPQLILDR